MQKRIDWKQIFPYEPRTEQVEFVDSIDKAIELGVAAILEGRNGLGKTLAALCGYLQYNIPIIYVTRTHQQVRHIFKEIVKIRDKIRELSVSSRISITATVIGSRKRLCLNPHLAGEPVFQKNPVLASRFCRQIYQSDRSGRKVCSFLNRSGLPVELDVEGFDNLGLPKVCSVDVLRQFGESNQICPYYLALHHAKTAHIIVSPYQYIIDPLLRKYLKIDLSGRALIIDEAHTIPSLCRSILSARINNYIIQKAYNEASRFGHPALERKIRDVKRLFRQVPTPKMRTLTEKKYLFGDIFKEVLKLEGFQDGWFEEFSNFQGIVEQIQNEMLRTTPEKCYLFEVLDFFTRIHYNDPASSIVMWESRRTRAGMNKTISYSCLDPSLIFKPLQSMVGSLLLMSGTLSPRKMFQLDLGIPKAYSQEFSPLTRDNCIATVIRKFDGVALSTSWEDRKNEEKVQKYGEVLLEFLKMIPQASLVFFPSYSVKEAFLVSWEGSGLYNEMDEIADIYTEDTTPEFEAVKIPEFLQKSQTRKTVMFAVTRGKISEGFDAPGIIKGVFVLGVPLADWGSPQIQAQIEFQNKRRGQGEGNRWYQQEAAKWTNQNAGRGIRLLSDFCAVVLIDRRFGSGQYYHKLSDSLRNCMLKPTFNMLPSYAKKKIGEFFAGKIPDYAPI